MKGFYRKKGGARELLAKEKKGLFQEQDIFGVGGEQEGFLSFRLPFLSVGDRGCLHDKFLYWCLARKFQIG